MHGHITSRLHKVLQFLPMRRGLPVGRERSRYSRSYAANASCRIARAC
jgi:hypothetical protein